MERSKGSQSPAVRWALELAIDGATPEVIGASSAGVPTCIDLPSGLVKMPNESARRAKLKLPRSANGGRGPLAASRAGANAACTKMHQNAPFCTAKSSNAQNEPNSRKEESPGLRCATPRGMAQGALATGAAPGIASSARRVQNEPKCTDLHQNAPKCTVPRSPAQNEPNSARRDDPLPELTPRQLQAIALLFAGRSYTDVGRELRINRSTLFRWRRSPTFVDEVRRRYALSARGRSVIANGRHA